MDLRRPSPGPSTVQGPPAPGRSPRRARAGVALVALVGIIPFLGLDPFTSGLRAALAPHEWLRSYLDPLRDFGLFFTQVLVLAAVALLDPRRRRWAVLGLVAVCITTIAVHGIKAGVGRLRPETGSGALAFSAPWPPERIFEDPRKSFPSGHAASSFALAGVLAHLYPRGRVLFLVLASGCALSRVLDGRHFPSDVYAGALIGLGVAGWTIARWGHRCDPPSSA